MSLGTLTFTHPFKGWDKVIRCEFFRSTFKILFFISGELLRFNADAVTIAKLILLEVDFGSFNGFSFSSFSFVIVDIWTLLLDILSSENVFWIGNNSEKKIKNNLKVGISKDLSLLKEKIEKKAVNVFLNRITNAIKLKSLINYHMSIEAILKPNLLRLMKL